MMRLLRDLGSSLISAHDLLPCPVTGDGQGGGLP